MIAVHWFRRDLRLSDNTGLNAALQSGKEVLPIFIFDDEILQHLPEDDARLTFIHGELTKMHEKLQSINSGFAFRYASPLEAWKSLIEKYPISEVHFNRDYEPYAIQRDQEIREFLESKGIAVFSHKDQVIFEQDEVMKPNGTPYTVFTPYSKTYLKHLVSPPISQTIKGRFLEHSEKMPSLAEMGFRTSAIQVKPFDLNVADQYKELRNFPAQDATSYLSVHLRFGTVSVRKIWNSLGAEHFALKNELMWREFFMQILYHFPHSVDQNFKPQYNAVAWRNNEDEFEAWCQGKTGYPMVDAGMRELNESGYMHNRVRMVTASFLCKHLLIDWRWGERYFAEKLLDFDLSANVGNWQWAAGTGCDAAPYFRVFNPSEQAKKFDSKAQYMNRWIPELNTLDYPHPIVEHKMARNRAIATYKAALNPS